ncbi:MAG: adenylate/guanylate cyclase domain-containing protein [Deltaproteobacteria bacterium]|nr:adenylate/guanylate cyclase domain-containing protein [Deltaproteobacteria bacterium]
MADESFKRKLAAILSADVAGYSRLMSDNEAATVSTLTAYREVMASLIKQHRGRVVDTPGDNLLAEFPSVVDAVQCAVAVQKELKARNMELPDQRKMQYRIGINLGDVIEEQGSIYGDGVNIAARLEAIADPGGICISRTAYDQIEDKLPLGYEYLGERNVKNIPKPVRAYRVLLEPEQKGQGSSTTSESKPSDAKGYEQSRKPGAAGTRFSENVRNFMDEMGFDEKARRKLWEKGAREMRRAARAERRKRYKRSRVKTSEDSIERRVHAKMNFTRHLQTFLAVGVGFLVINLITSPRTLWFFWPMLPWALGLFIHWVGALAFTGGRIEKMRGQIAKAASRLSDKVSGTETLDELIEVQLESKVKFYKHLYIFLGVTGFFLFINLITSPGTLWFCWPVFPWGVGLFIHWIHAMGFKAVREEKRKKSQREKEEKQQPERD